MGVYCHVTPTILLRLDSTTTIRRADPHHDNGVLIDVTQTFDRRVLTVVHLLKHFSLHWAGPRRSTWEPSGSPTEGRTRRTLLTSLHIPTSLRSMRRS